MQKQPRILPPQKIFQHLLRLSPTPLHIHRLQNRHNILEQELRITRPPIRSLRTIRIQELEDLELATYPFARSGDELRVAGEERRRQVPEPRDPVRAHVQRVEFVPVYMSPAEEGFVCCYQRSGFIFPSAKGPSSPMVKEMLRPRGVRGRLCCSRCRGDIICPERVIIFDLVANGLDFGFA